MGNLLPTPPAAAGAGGAAGAAGANGQQQQQGGGFNFGGIVRMIMMYQVIGYFFKGNTTTVTAPDGTPRPPHTNLWPAGQAFDLRVYVSDSSDFDAATDAVATPGALGSLLWELKGLTYDYAPQNERALNITLSQPLLDHLKANNSLWAHAYATKRGYSHLKPAGADADAAAEAEAEAEAEAAARAAAEDDDDDVLAVGNSNKRKAKSQPAPKKPKVVRDVVVTSASGAVVGKYNPLANAYSRVQLNVYKPKPKVTADKNLISGEYADTRVKSAADAQRVLDAKGTEPVEWANFWKPVLNPRLVDDHTAYGYGQIPPELKSHIALEPITGGYWPPIYWDYFWVLSDRHVEVNDSVTSLSLELQYSTISMFKWRIELQMEESWRMQESWGGSTSSETDMFKRMFLESNPILLAITMVVSVLHMIFDFLAFKNDIAFWKENKSLEGLSVRTIFINAWCQVIIFLYLLDNETSLMILASSGIGLVIEFWKIKQACDVTLSQRWPFVSVKDKTSYTESGTSQYDKEAMRYMSWVMYPLVLCYSIYALVYQSHKSWYSWVLGSLVGAVYAFGFILMVPQLYLNYKLKSVAHLPWRMLTYKALNTFIDDLFAFVITMPTLHRLSCFRDDLIFFIYLYQKWIYPTDMTRVNEFGFTPKTDEQVKADAKAAADAKTADGKAADGAVVADAKAGTKADAKADGKADAKAAADADAKPEAAKPAAAKADGTAVKRRATKKD